MGQHRATCNRPCTRSCRRTCPPTSLPARPPSCRSCSNTSTCGCGAWSRGPKVRAGTTGSCSNNANGRTCWTCTTASPVICERSASRNPESLARVRRRARQTDVGDLRSVRPLGLRPPRAGLRPARACWAPTNDRSVRRRVLRPAGWAAGFGPGGLARHHARHRGADEDGRFRLAHAQPGMAGRGHRIDRRDLQRARQAAVLHQGRAILRDGNRHRVALQRAP